MATLIARLRATLSSQDGSMAPVVVMSMVVVMITSMFALMMSASLATDAKNRAMVDSSADVAASFADQIATTPKEGLDPGALTVIEATEGGLTRKQALKLGEDQLLTHFSSSGIPQPGPAAGVDAGDGMWMKVWDQ